MKEDKPDYLVESMGSDSKSSRENNYGGDYKFLIGVLIVIAIGIILSLFYK